MADPYDIVASVKAGGRVVGWKLKATDRHKLLKRFTPLYVHVVADHVTLAANVAPATPLPEALPATVVGYTSDNAGVEVLVVALDGSTERPDGSTYHMTWSLGPGRRAQESNDVIARHGWTKLETPLPVKLLPAFLR